MSQKWTKQDVIDSILKKYRGAEKLNSNHIQVKECGLYGAANRLFGSWKSAIEAAGLDYSQIRKRKPLRSWSKKLIIDEIIRRNREGQSIGGGDVYNEDRGLYLAAMRHFGKKGWARARVLAGFDPIDPRPWKIWNENSVPEEIKRLHESGVELSTVFLQKSDFAYILAAGCTVFGSWSKAIHTAGLCYSKIKKTRSPNWWTEKRVVMCIKNLEKRGIRLNSTSIQSSHGGLFQAAIKYFGCWSLAVEASGIPYQRHCKVWSYKAWLRKIDMSEYEKILETNQNLSRRRTT